MNQSKPQFYNYLQLKLNKLLQHQSQFQSDSTPADEQPRTDFSDPAHQGVSGDRGIGKKQVGADNSLKGKQVSEREGNWREKEIKMQNVRDIHKVRTALRDHKSGEYWRELCEFSYRQGVDLTASGLIDAPW